MEAELIEEMGELIDRLKGATTMLTNGGSLPAHIHIEALTALLPDIAEKMQNVLDRMDKEA